MTKEDDLVTRLWALWLGGRGFTPQTKMRIFKEGEMRRVKLPTFERGLTIVEKGRESRKVIGLVQFTGVDSSCNSRFP